MDQEIDSLCPKVWEVVDVDKEKFLQGWKNIEQYAEEASSIPLNIKLLLAAVGFYDPVMLATLTEKEIGIAESCTRSLMVSKVNCGATDHNCEELVRKSLWGGHFNRPQNFCIKPGYKNVLLFITKILKGKKGIKTYGKRSLPDYLKLCEGEEPTELAINTSLLYKKVNKWILSKNTDSKNFPVMDIQISTPGKAEILCPYCESRIQATYHGHRWVISNFQKHYDRHFLKVVSAKKEIAPDGDPSYNPGSSGDFPELGQSQEDGVSTTSKKTKKRQLKTEEREPKEAKVRYMKMEHYVEDEDYHEDPLYFEDKVEDEADQY